MTSYLTIGLNSQSGKARARGLIDRAPADCVCIVRKATRTDDQNRKMQAMLTDVALAKPGGRVLRTDQWKCLFMDALAQESGNASFTARWEPGLDGDGVVNLGYRSSRLNKSDMGDLISFIDAWGTQHGVVWSDPETRDQEAA